MKMIDIELIDDPFVIAGMFFWVNASEEDDAQRDAWRLCHGLATSQRGSDIFRGARAWTECRGRCIDVRPSGQVLTLPRVVFYAMGGIEPDDVHRYDMRSVVKRWKQSHHWGPWDVDATADPEVANAIRSNAYLLRYLSTNEQGG